MPGQASTLRASVISFLIRRFNLRFPGVFLFLAIITLADLLIPDLIPFVDEIGLALLTLLFAMWKNRRAPLTPDRPGNA